MRTGLKLLLITLPLTLSGVGFLAYTVINKAPPARTELAERAIAVRVITAKPFEITPQISGFGLVKPARTYAAIAQVGGTADYVNPALQKGAILPAGTVLLRLSPTDFNLAIAQALANIRAAEARLSELTISGANLTAALEIEREALDLKARDLERAARLFKGGAVAQTTLDNARAAHLAQRQKVQNVESALALLPTQREVQSEQIAVYRASLDTAKLNLARTELTLPFAARVAAVTVQTGQFVRTGTTAAQFDGVDAAEIEAQVSVADLRRLLRLSLPMNSTAILDPASMNDVLHNLGLRASVHLRLGNEQIVWQGSVDRISDTIDPKTGTLGVIVRVDNAYTSANPGTRPPLTKGMFVEVNLQAPPISGLILPRSAVQNGRVLLVDSDNRLRIAEVTTSLAQGDITMIASGLSQGDRVVVSAVSPVIDGMLLETTKDVALMAQLAKSGAAK
ncbi:MAG: efflux RND transporter periplasmic adaptor subunit [Alphaproteobacteria bacterium]|nr:efflux RND transporter periplasmic adaptor subunit [Alphaproteobacteria bacterium]